MRMARVQHLSALVSQILSKLEFDLKFILYLFSEQLREIKKASLARLVCNDFDINQIQPNVFLQPMSTVK